MSPRLVAVALAALAGALAHSSGSGALVGGPLMDRLQRARRGEEVRPVRPDVALVGVSAAERAEWPRLGPRLLRALDLAHAEAVGLLPPLAAGEAGLILEPPFEARRGQLEGEPPPTAIAPAALDADPDGVVRRLRLTGPDGRASLVARLAGSLGVVPAPGFVDYGLGRPLDYDGLGTLLRWESAGDVEALERKLRGRPVLVGLVGDGAPGRASPVPVAGWVRPGEPMPEIAVHAQALRTLVAGRAIAPVPAWLTALAIAVCAAVGGVSRRTGVAVALAALCGLALVQGEALLLARGGWLPPAGPVASLLAAAVLVFSRAAAKPER